MRKRNTIKSAVDRGKWWRFAAILVITAIVLVPIAAVLYLSVQPSLGSTATGMTLENFSNERIHLFDRTTGERIGA